MDDAVVADISDFLDENGDLLSGPRQMRRQGEFLASVVLMATYPERNLPDGYQAHCRRRPHKQPCRAGLLAFVLPESDTIAWLCPACGDNGLIRGWQGTMWDMSPITVAH